ncbi:MAG: 30S ribosomal protein S9 [Parcubacteria group bacterium]|jgi:small subunit ribosomal protein S9
MATKKAKKTEKEEAKVKKTEPAVEIKEIKETGIVKEKKLVGAKTVADKAVSEKYFYAVGRRKTSVAQVRIIPSEKAGDNDYVVNNKKVKEYFPGISLQNAVFGPLKTVGSFGKFKFSILVRGGGFKGQAEASKLGIARALVKYDEKLRKVLKDLGFLTRDSRKVERKKPGLKKARKSPQWAKR